MAENINQKVKTKKKKEGFFSSIFSVSSIKNNQKIINEMVTSLKPTNNVDNDETYEDALKRLEVTDKDVLQNYKNFVYSLYISMAFSLFCFIGALGELFIKKEFLIGVSFLVFMVLCLINAFRFSYRALQIKRKEFCSAKEWWESPNDWFPAIPNSKKRK